SDLPRPATKLFGGRLISPGIILPLLPLRCCSFFLLLIVRQWWWADGWQWLPVVSDDEILTSGGSCTGWWLVVSGIFGKRQYRTRNPCAIRKFYDGSGDELTFTQGKSLTDILQNALGRGKSKVTLDPEMRLLRWSCSEAKISIFGLG
ncbi:hypothetical protein Dimus_033366, partial [Dionaea muscipula]